MALEKPSAGPPPPPRTDVAPEAEGACQSPLSFIQESLWFFEQMAPGTSVYNLPEAWRLQGALDLPALERSLAALVARHETLRTVIAARDGRPVQVVLPIQSFTLPLVDLAKSQAKEDDLQSRLAAEAKRPFDLTHGPLARTILFRLGEKEHVLLLNMHHLICDEWSCNVFMRDLAERYRACLAGEPLPAGELPIQYADFAAWQRETLTGALLEKQLQYWKAQLRGPLPVMTVPADFPRSGVRSYLGTTLFSALPKVLTEDLRELSRREGVTLFMTLLAAFQTLLHRYTREEDIIVGSPMGGRERIETEGLIGLFINTYALRTNLSGDPTFLELLQRVREVVLGAYAHQEVSLDQVIEALQPERQAGWHPLFQTVLGLQPALTKDWSLPGLTASRIELDNGGSKFDCTLLLTETDEGLQVRCEYSTELFEAGTMARLVRHFQTLLEGIVAHPQRRLSELPLLSELEHKQWLAAWQQELPATPRGLCVHQWFEAQAESTPDATAVVYEQQRLSYRELNARANQLAHYLKRFSVGPEVPVALCLERGREMMVAILGVLKAGGAYVPIDPGCPPERLRFMLEDTRAPVLVTDKGGRDRMIEWWSDGVMEHPEGPRSSLINGAGRDTVPSTSGGGSEERRDRDVAAYQPPRMVCLDSDWERIGAESADNLAGGATADNTAYIIYTSGSTGRAKGVLVTHHNVVRLFKQTHAWFGFHASDVWTLFHAYTFDFSVWEIWGALLYGGRLVIVPFLVSRAPGEFYELLAREQVTVLNQTPSAFRQLLWAEATAGRQLPLNLRYVIFGGEALELQSLKPWFDRHGDERPRLINMYGITETTVHVTYRPIRLADLSAGLGSVIGVPIPDLRLALLDERGHPVAVGLPGEVCVGGDGVARGYLNRPELTSQRFVADPFSLRAGGRLYRSGDLARYTSQGELEYLGRMDHQVKVRGFRVELGEIESALNRHPGVRESVVVAREDGASGKRLVAYYVPVKPEMLPKTGLVPTEGHVPVTLPSTSSSTLSDSGDGSDKPGGKVEDKVGDKLEKGLGQCASCGTGLREYLSRELPDYMIPSAFVPLEVLPLTVNGKVDRRALPAPVGAEGQEVQPRVLPRNPAEKQIAGIWCEVLGCPSVGVTENFFHLGGHSLLATQIISRIAVAFNVELSVRMLFEAPTVAWLAQAVERAQREQSVGMAPVPRLTREPQAADLLACLDQLSAAQIEALLREEEERRLCS